MNEIIVNTNVGKIFLDLSEIVYLKANGKKTEVILDNSSILLANHSLGWFQDNLPKKYFIRIHKSYIVNKAHIESFTANNTVMDHQQILPVGRCYKRGFASGL